MKKLLSRITGSTVALYSSLLARAVSAQNNAKDENWGLNYVDNTGLGTKDLRESIIDIVNVALGFLGILAVVVILVGGFKWMTAGGNEENVAEAKKLIGAGIVGIVIVLSAFSIASFVISKIETATTK